jgi:ribosomal protein L11 methyltransferase
MNDFLSFKFTGVAPPELEDVAEAIWWNDDESVEGIISISKSQLILDLVPHAFLSPLEERDWLKEDEQRLPPLEVGPFFIHGPHYISEKKGWVIESAHAFGSGHHPTTHRCLETLLNLSKSEKISKALDLGCGSGILAMGIAHLWKAAVFASDCEKQSVEAAARNFERNGFSQIKIYESFGLDHSELKRNAPYNLIVANIHSGPLCEMASDIITALAPNGILLLSGMLIEQEREVKEAYSSLDPISSFYDGNWTTILFRKK